MSRRGPRFRADSSPRTALLPAVTAVLALLGALTFAGTPLSGATFTSTSSSQVSVNAAADWLPPTVSVNAPSTTLSGTTTITVTAADTGGSGVATVTLQYSPAGAGTWTTLCTTSTSPYGCSWNTALVPDGSYDLRATAVDNAGFSATSATVTVRVANQLGVVLAPITDPAHGTVTLRVDYVNPNPSVPLVLSFQYAPAGGSSFASLPGCPASASGATSWTCSFNTAGLAGGDYDIEGVGTSGGKPVQTFTDVQYAVTIDNNPPTTTLSVPTGTLSGTVPVTATATDNETSVVSTAFQYRPTGGSTWTTVCTDTATPYACSVTTAGWTNGASYDFRSVATDEAGNTGASAIITRTVDNTVASVSVTSPLAGAVLRGSVAITADASSTKGVATVALQYRVGAGSWQPICTATTAPYGCTWDSTVVLKSSVDLRAVMTDSAGASVTSAIVTVSVDNSPLRAQDVQASNGGTAGRVDSGDKLILTYSNVVDPGTVLAGWTGAATTVTATLKDAAVSGGPVPGDWMTVGAGSNGNTAVSLGQVAFGENYVKSKKSVGFSATMTAATQTVGGQQVTVVTITLGGVSSGSAGSLRQTTAAGTMTWAPSTAVRTPSGVVCSSTSVTETGTADQDF